MKPQTFIVKCNDPKLLEEHYNEVLKLGYKEGIFTFKTAKNKDYYCINTRTYLHKEDFLVLFVNNATSFNKEKENRRVFYLPEQYNESLGFAEDQIKIIDKLEKKKEKEIELNVWYKRKPTGKYYCFYEKHEEYYKSYTLINNNWTKYTTYCIPDAKDYIKVSKEEITEALTEYAKSIGLVPRAYHKGLPRTNSKYVTLKLMITQDYYLKDNCFWNNGCLLMKNGVWTELYNETIKFANKEFEIKKNEYGKYFRPFDYNIYGEDMNYFITKLKGLYFGDSEVEIQSLKIEDEIITIEKLKEIYEKLK